VVQLRQENLRADSYNVVGFQNHLKFGEQARILRLIPGLENAIFLRYGQIHRNTYINGPTLLRETLQMKQHPNVLFAGQISGVEGYVESIATGLLAGMQASALARDAEPIPPPRATMPRTSSRPTLPLTCCNRSTTRLGAAFATRSSATPWSASGRWRS
jgi:methylenetetrahydrofolate--tRNA-(uracil-5-)-methyltransferase